MSESSFVQFKYLPKAVVAKILREKISDPESGPIQTELVKAGPAAQWRLAIDMSEVRFLTSAGIGLLVSVHKACVAGKGVMAIFGLDEQIMKVMQVTRIDKVFRILPDEAAALKVVS